MTRAGKVCFGTVSGPEQPGRPACEARLGRDHRVFGFGPLNQESNQQRRRRNRRRDWNIALLRRQDRRTDRALVRIFIVIVVVPERRTGYRELRDQAQQEHRPDERG